MIQVICLKIGNVILDGKVMCAPMAGITNRVYRKIAKEYGIEKISDIKSSLGIVATDLIKEKEVWFTSKKIEDENAINNKINIIDVDIGKAIRASSSYSILFDPCFIDDNVYIDGGAVNNTPIDLAKALGADKVLAVRFEEDKFLEANNLNIIKVVGTYKKKNKYDYISLGDKIKANKDIAMVIDGEMYCCDNFDIHVLKNKIQIFSNND